MEIYNLFYTNTWTKIIKPELFEFSDHRCIAYWIMSGGSKRNKGII